MSLHHPEFVMFPEETGDRSSIGKIVIHLKLGERIDLPPKLSDLFVKKFRLPQTGIVPCFSDPAAVYQKVKLDLFPVNLPVQIHDTALRAARPDSAEHMQHSDWL